MKSIFLALCGVLTALAAPAETAARTQEHAMSRVDEQALARQHNTTWKATSQRIRGITGDDGQPVTLEVGATLHLTAPPPIAAIRAGLRPAVDQVASRDLELENVVALLDEARRDRDRATEQRDALRVECDGLRAQVVQDGHVIAGMRAELGAMKDARAIAEADVARLTSELARRPPEPTLAEKLDKVAVKTLLAAVNTRREAEQLEPIGGAGAAERARTYLLESAPDLAGELVGEPVA